MIITLWLKNFRRFKDEKFTFTSGVNTIHGDNNVGKTTLLYAIEYVLFGRVGNFRAINPLMPPKERNVAVEIVFQGNDEQFYQLQRLHIIPAKAKTKVLGHYTLKKFSFDPRQSNESADCYILSSDFQDREEALALKIQEILGISHKLFDVAINLRQGEITTILEGAAKLDVVLGITAAILSAEELRSMALNYEKETAALTVYNETMQRLTLEKKEDTQKHQELNHESSKIAQALHDLSEVSQLKSAIEKLRLPLLESHKTLMQSHLEWQKNQLHLAETTTDLTHEMQNLGSNTQLNDEIKRLESKSKTHLDEKKTLIEQQKNWRSQQRTLDTEHGDLNGRIKRREALPSKHGAICESCGQRIDIHLNQQEIDKWQSQCLKITTALKVIQQQLDDSKHEVVTLDKNISDLQWRTSEIEHQQKSLQQLKQKQEILSQNNTTLTSENKSKTTQLIKAIKNYQHNIKSLTIIEAYQTVPTLSIEIPLAEQDEMEAFIKQVEQALFALNERLQLTLVKAETECNAQQQNQQRIAKEQQHLTQKTEALEKTLSDTQSSIDALQHKTIAAQKLRHLADGFKVIQGQLRDQSSLKLAEKTLQNYQILAQNNTEFKKLSIDKNSYSLLVTSNDLNKEMPASLSEGGGHKLLLSLAFKFAIGQVVGPCPFILLDEPTYGLDKIRKANLFKHLNELDVSRQLIMISHDIETSGSHIFIKRQGKHSQQTESKIS